MSLEQATELEFGGGFNLGPFYPESALLLTRRLNSVPSQFLNGHLLVNVAKAVGKEQFSNDFFAVECTSKHFHAKTSDGYEWSWVIWFKVERYLEEVGRNEINGLVVLM